MRLKTCDKYIKNADINKKPMKRITQKEWIRFLQDIYDSGSPTEEDPKRRISAKDLGRIKCVVRGILNRAEDEDLITYTADEVISHVRTDVNGFRHTTSSTEDEVYYRDELQALKAYCLSNPDPYTRCILMAIISGERIGECVVLFAEDIDLDEHYILIRRTETQADDTGKQMETVREGAKTQAGIRRVAIPDSALEWVGEIKEIAEKTGGGYLFKQEPGRFKERYVGNRIRASQVRRHLKKICAELNIPYRPPHKFRKTYASPSKLAFLAGFEPTTFRLGAGLSPKKARKGGLFRAPIFVVTHFVTQLLRRWDLKPMVSRKSLYFRGFSGFGRVTRSHQ